MDYADIIVRHVPNYGFMPIIKVGDVEHARGSFYKSPKDAFGVGLDLLDKVIENILQGHVTELSRKGY